VVRVVADCVLKDATFQFIDQKGGTYFKSLDEILSDAQLRLESHYNDWRYWNGVLNIAMLKLKNVL
jgi:unsaturated rhamnogalacturonyl hydrolase